MPVTAVRDRRMDALKSGGSHLEPQATRRPGLKRAGLWDGTRSQRRKGDRVIVSDLHATLLHLPGLDHTRLTYFYQGPNQRLTGVRGNVIGKVLARTAESS